MNTLILPPGTRKDRGFTQDLFSPSSLLECLSHPYWGCGVCDDFVGGADSRYVETDLNGATATVTHRAERHGVIRLDPGATTADDGVQLQMGNGSFLPVAGSIVAWETLVKLSTISTEPNLLIGLAEDDTSVLADSGGAIAVDDFIGFVMTGDDLELDFHVRVGGTSNVLETGCGADVVDGAWMHLGFRVEDGKRFIPFVNKVRIDEDIVVSAAAVPTVPLAPTWAITTAGTVRPLLDIDWHIGVDTYKADVR